MPELTFCFPSLLTREQTARLYFLFGKIGVGLSRTKPQRRQGGAGGDYFL